MKKIGLIILIILAAVLVFRDFIIKEAIISVGSSVLGAPVKLEGFSLSLLTRRVEMNEMKIYNPPTFSNNVLIDIKHIKVAFHPIALLSGKMYFDLIDLDVHQLAIERNKQGEFNVAALKIKPQKSDKPLDMHIDTLKLNVDQVTLRDESKSLLSKEINQGIGLHQKEFKNITSPQQLVSLVLFESSGLSSLKGMAMNVSKELLSNVTDLTKGLTGDAKNTANSLFGSLKSVINK